MRSHSQIVKAAGSVEAVAEKHSVSVHTVRSWIQRNSIPSDQWNAFAGDSVDLLREIAVSAEQKIQQPADRQQADAA